MYKKGVLYSVDDDFPGWAESGARVRLTKTDGTTVDGWFHMEEEAGGDGNEVYVLTRDGDWLSQVSFWDFDKWELIEETA